MLAKNLKQFFNTASSQKSLLTQFSLRHASQFVTVPGTPEAFDLKSIAFQKASEDLLIDQPWTTKPFVSTIQMPVFNLLTGAFTG